MSRKLSKMMLVLATSTALLANNALAKYSEKTVENGGSIHGSVLFNGDPSKRDKAQIDKDNEVCGEGDTIPNPVTVGADGGLENVVVYLEKVKAGKAWPKKDYVVDQKKCSFEPYLQVVPKGVEMTIRNSDPVLHNVHPFEIIGDSRRTLFNLAQPKQNQENKKKIRTRRGKAVELACDAHAWMAGWLYVLEHPYFAVVGDDGQFQIGDVPPGKYKLVAWHPVLGLKEQAIEVGAGAATEAAFRFESNE